MEDSKKGEGGEKESPSLQIDPKCLQDALRAFFQPIKTDDPRVDFYTMYKREATEYDADYVKKYDEDLNTTLIFAGLFSAVSSAFVIDVHSNLQPNPNDQSAALLRAILLTLNQSAIPGETPVVPPVQGDPPSEIVTVTCLMYTSLMISLLAAFVAMLGKQWLNRYLRNSGGSMIERCGDRQRKCDGLEKWPLHFFVESLPMMLQAALLLLACGLCRYMWSINTFVARTLIGLTGLGVVFYVAIVIAGMSSYACPFQTPASLALRGPWKKVRHGIISFIIHPKRVLLRTRRMWDRGVRSFLRRQSLPTTIPFETIQIHESEPWMKPKDLAIIRRTNVNDVRCVSWILRNITDPEALDAAIRLAGVVRWFDDGTDVDLPYDQIVSTFEACFDSTGTLYPGSRDRAYYSGRAMMWIHTLARCKSDDFASTFIPPDVEYTTPVPDPDLEHFLEAIPLTQTAPNYLARLVAINSGHTHPHSQWISNLLLHYSRASQAGPNYSIAQYYASRADEAKTTIPLGATLNRLLMWCIFLGSPVEEEALKVQDKSDRIEPILDRLSKAVLSAINDNDAITQRGYIKYMLRDLFKLENRPGRLTEIAYEWCSVIFENRRRLWDWESLLLVCLEIGFRHLDFQRQSIEVTLTHTEHHRELADIVFKSRKSEVIADLLHAWTVKSESYGPAYELLDLCVGHLVDLHNMVLFSSRLRQLVIRSVKLIGYMEFRGVSVERFIGLLNHLQVTDDDMDFGSDWKGLLLDTTRSSKGVQHLPHWYWELLVKLAVLQSHWLISNGFAYSPQITTFLTEAQEWSKLECWVGTVWVVWPPGAGEVTEEGLNRLMVLLFRQRPGALRRLEQWMERSQGYGNDIPKSFKRLCKQAHEAAQQDTPPISSTDEGIKELAYSSSFVPSPSSEGSKFWESLPYYVP